jgi:amino acid adenylation domain-containing protein
MLFSPLFLIYLTINFLILKEHLKAVSNLSINSNNLSKLIEKTAGLYPDKIGVVYRDEQLSYKELIALSNQFANYLLASGIRQGDIIGLAVECSIEMLVCMLGLLRAGAVYVPLDPKYPQDRIEYMLNHSEAKMLIVTRVNQGRFHSVAAENIVEDFWPQLQNFSVEVDDDEVFNSGLAYVLYTSGSTGKPKGVEITHANLINLLTSVQTQPGITPDDRLLAITTISFDIAGLELFLPLLTGALLVISDLETARDGRLLLDILEEKDITIMQATPSTWRMMLDSGWVKKYPVKIFCGGEPLPKDLAHQLLDKAAELWNMYGPTETTIYSIIKKISKADEVITIGWPINNTQVYLLDPQQTLVPDGEAGEIYIGGLGVSAGYLNQPALTAERFIADPFSSDPDSRLYRTGDLGKYIGNKDIDYLGRIDQQVKIRGHRIELGEIENVLRQHPLIKQAVVLAREDQPGDKRLASYVTLADPSSVGMRYQNIVDAPRSLTDSFRDHLKNNVPEYMVPYDYVVLLAFPLTPNHKIDKIKLPKPVQRITALQVSHQPKNKIEKIVSNIFAKALGIANISVQDDFFDMGGNSLLAVKIMASIERETGKRLPLATLFNNTTIEKLAAKINSDEEERWESLVPIRSTGSKSPVYLIHGGGLNIILFKTLAKDLPPDQPVYAFQALGLNKATHIPDTIEEIAAIYVKELLEANADGPYHLAGYSLGGFIAWEMARQLTAKGKHIKSLSILDTYAGAKIENNGIFGKIATKILRQFKKIPFIINSIKLYPKDTVDYQLMMLRDRLNGQGTDKDIPDVEFFSPYEKQIYNTYRAAQTHYKLEPANLKVTVFKVEKRLYFLDDLEQLGWGKLAKSGVQVKVVPGDHKTFLYPPHDIAFAALLQEELDR